jgi:hypothetical protein
VPEQPARKGRLIPHSNFCAPFSFSYVWRPVFGTKVVAATNDLVSPASSSSISPRSQASHNKSANSIHKLAITIDGPATYAFIRMSRETVISISVQKLVFEKILVMKLMITWLETLLSRWGAVSDAPGKPESVKPDELHLPKDMQDLVNDATMPDIYTDKHVPARKFLDPSSQDADKTTGFNPYDTAKMHKK